MAGRRIGFSLRVLELLVHTPPKKHFRFLILFLLYPFLFSPPERTGISASVVASHKCPDLLRSYNSDSAEVAVDGHYLKLLLQIKLHKRT